MTTPRIAEMAAFMTERHNIYRRRLNGLSGPWTTDPVLASGRFCNVFRELDTGTIWIRKNIREPFADHPNLWLMLAIARYINWPATLQKLFDRDAMPNHPDWEPTQLTYAMEELAKEGGKLYTGAYMIRAESDPNAPWYYWSKHRYIAEIVIGRLWRDRDDWYGVLDRFPKNSGELNTLEKIWGRFQEHKYIGWGPFMAYEVVTDMRHTRYLRDAPDILTWANAGPGAIRGLNYMYGRELKTHPKKEQTNTEMRMIMDELNSNGDLWPEHWPRLEMRDVEHSLCELFKYHRGSTRSKYDWRKATTLEQDETQV